MCARYNPDTKSMYVFLHSLFYHMFADVWPRDYLTWLTWQRTGPITIDTAGRNDIREMEVPQKGQLILQLFSAVSGTYSCESSTYDVSLVNAITTITRNNVAMG